MYVKFFSRKLCANENQTGPMRQAGQDDWMDGFVAIDAGASLAVRLDRSSYSSLRSDLAEYSWSVDRLKDWTAIYANQ